MLSLRPSQDGALAQDGVAAVAQEEVARRGKGGAQKFLIVRFIGKTLSL